MVVCQFQSNNSMYGIGIRLGYYLQWYGMMLARWIAPTEVKTLAFSTDVFVAATFLALMIETARDVDGLRPVETYIVLLLMFGVYLALVPLYIWRLLTRCDPYWDPARYPVVGLGALSANLSFVLLIALLLFQFWFVVTCSFCIVVVGLDIPSGQPMGDSTPIHRHHHHHRNHHILLTCKLTPPPGSGSTESQA